MVLASSPVSQSFANEAATEAAVFFVALASSAKKMMKDGRGDDDNETNQVSAKKTLCGMGAQT